MDVHDKTIENNNAIKEIKNINSNHNELQHKHNNLSEHIHHQDKYNLDLNNEHGEEIKVLKERQNCMDIKICDMDDTIVKNEALRQENQEHVNRGLKSIFENGHDTYLQKLENSVICLEEQSKTNQIQTYKHLKELDDKTKSLNENLIKNILDLRNSISSNKATAHSELSMQIAKLTEVVTEHSKEVNQKTEEMYQIIMVDKNNLEAKIISLWTKMLTRAQ